MMQNWHKHILNMFHVTCTLYWGLLMSFWCLHSFSWKTDWTLIGFSLIIFPSSVLLMHTQLMNICSKNISLMFPLHYEIIISKSWNVQFFKCFKSFFFYASVKGKKKLWEHYSENSETFKKTLHDIQLKV